MVSFMMRYRLLLAFPGLLFAVGCDDAPTAAADSDLIVVQAYLYAGEPVSDVRLTYTISLGSSDTTAPPINEAEVLLSRDGANYALVPTGIDGYYHYPGADLTVGVNDRFGIEVTFEGQRAVAETSVPPPPVSVAISGEVLTVPEFTRGRGGGGGGGGGFLDNSLDVTWDNPEGLLHFVAVESLDLTTESILPDIVRARFGGFRFVSEPTSGETYTINAFTLEYLGRHVARVYRVNEEYAALYLGRIQDSRDLNEPPTNIDGGLGVFSAFASDSVFFQVVRE